MVGDDGEVISFQVVAHSSETPDDGEAFQLRGAVIPLRRIKGPTSVRDDALSFGQVLCKYGPEAVCTRVRLQYERACEIGAGEHRGGC